MFSIQSGQPTRLCDGLNRRELLQLGGLGSLGLSLPMLLNAQALAKTSQNDSPSFGRAKNCIFLWLQGGPPQHETFDPKPAAPLEIRGPFQPISTNVPGIQFSELLPRTAQIADKLAIVRSMATDDNTHSSSGYWMLTGYQHDATTARVVRPSDWPYFGSLVKMLKPSETMAPLTSVWLPDIMRLNDNVQPAGQTGGLLGKQWDPQWFICNPAQADYEIEGLGLPAEVSPMRLNHRLDLLKQVERHFSEFDRGQAVREFNRINGEAVGLLTGGKARRAFDIDREPVKLRERYGVNQWGQCVLLARRLIEAGVRLVHVNWTREPGDTSVDNPMWDTHAQNADRLQDVLCPQFDVGFSALIHDLDQRGLLEETLVVAVGEFGRTPKINSKGGRDHWGPVFSLALAGAGVSGAQVFGSSDKNGGYPTADRVEPPDFTATLFHLLGIDHQSTFFDRAGRELSLTKGEPIYKLLGDSPATALRTQPEGDVAFVPPFDGRPLRNTQFADAVPLHPIASGRRTKGWHAEPLLLGDNPADFGVRLCEQEQPSGSTPADHRCAVLGFASAPSNEEATGSSTRRALLTQELLSPRAGQYVFSVQARTVAQSQQLYDAFLKQFRCRLQILGYKDLKKDPREARVFATTDFLPPYADDPQSGAQEFSVSAYLRSQDGGAFETSLGVGVAVIVEQSTAGTLDAKVAQQLAGCFVQIADTKVRFDARPRREDVQV